MKNARKLKPLSLVIFSILMLCFENRVEGQVPNGFVEVTEFVPDAKIELRYFSTNNFIGDTIDGYKADKLYISREAAKSLFVSQKKFKALGFGLKFFDAYRPQKAVDHFVRWAKILEDTTKKSAFYPNAPKSELFQRGYIASKSGHSRGSTTDLTIINLKTVAELDMSSPFDLFDPKSHHSIDF
jgi:D-alanyl-D-alanine dipeptidase